MTVYGQQQNMDSLYNLDFEKINNGIPVNWHNINTGDTSNYKVFVDSLNAKSGKYAAGIEFTGSSLSYKTITFVLPNNYEGKKITISGYIKTEGITEGYAGLRSVINHINGFDIIARDDKTRISGTTDWKKYEMALNLNPANTSYIMFDGILSGNGKMWLDNIKITIDGKDVQHLEPYIHKPFPAENDKEFDNGSNIIFPELNKYISDNLELLGKVWGFLKYHHPAIAKGNYNWDYELFRLLPDYINTNDNTQRDKLLLDRIVSLGDIMVCDNCVASSDNVFIKPDLSWIESSNMSSELKNKLQYIYLNRFQGNHYYIMMGGFENPLFLNEREYAEMPYPDAGFRLLSLYRYWNIVNYFSPSKHLTDKAWNNVLCEYIPYFVNAKNQLDYELATIQLIGEICDSHAANFLKGGHSFFASKGFGRAPIKTRFIENELVVTDYYTLKDTVITGDEVKLKVGDIITHINGKPVDAIIDSLSIYYPASNEVTRKKNMALDLLRSNQRVLNVDFISSGRKSNTAINLFSPFNLEMYETDTTACYRFLNEGKNIGYIKLNTLNEKDIPIIIEKFMNAKGIVIDIRGYPAITGSSLSSWFVSSETPFIKHTKGNPDNPGEFIFTRYENVSPSKKTFQGKLIALVNEETISQGEYQAMALRAGQNTIIVGSQTSGANGRVSDILLPGGIKTWISGLGVFYPTGQETQRIGIIPDIEFKPTVKGVMEGRDELLEKAIDLVNNE